MDEDESDDKARDELKRIDHLLFVTLKYTRTVDIIRTILQKFILTLDHKAEQYHEELFEKGKIKSIPPVPLMRMKNVEKLHPKDKTIKNMVDFYVLLKKITKAEYKAKEEYRKNVTLVTKDGEVNIAALREYVEFTKDYVEYVNELKK